MSDVREKRFSYIDICDDYIKYGADMSVPRLLHLRCWNILGIKAKEYVEWHQEPSTLDIVVRYE